MTNFDHVHEWEPNGTIGVDTVNWPNNTQVILWEQVCVVCNESRVRQEEMPP